MPKMALKYIANPEKLFLNYSMFLSYSSIVSEAKRKVKYGEGLKILIPQQVLQRLPIVF